MPLYSLGTAADLRAGAVIPRVVWMTGCTGWSDEHQLHSKKDNHENHYAGPGQDRPGRGIG